MVATQARRQRSSVRIGLTVFVGILVVQFLLGIWVNLFVDVPQEHPGAHPSEYPAGLVQGVTWAILQGPSVWLLFHTVLGLMTVLGAFGLLIWALLKRSLALSIALAVGAIALLVAGFNGGSFLNYHQDLYSMLMATGFAVALIAYTIALAIA